MSGPFGSSQWMYNPGGGFYGYEIDGSLRFNNPDQPRLTRAVTHNTKTFTINFWVKRAKLGRYWLYGVYSNSANTANLNFEADGTLVFYDYLSAYRFRLVTTRVFRDVGAWYCITLSVDTTQSTASDRIKIFVNGVQETSFSTATYPSQNLDLKFGGGGTHAIGTEGTNNRLWWDGYLANWALIDGQALDPTSFGEFKSGIWIPKNVTGLTYGSGGYLLEFAGNANDTSGNGNNWSATNINSWDYGPDSPTNNFNIGLNTDTEGPGTIVEAGLRSYVTAQGNYYSVGTSMGVKGGKWYYESRRIRGGNNSSGLPEEKLLPDGRYCNSGDNPTGSISINVGTQDGSDGVYMTALDLDNGYVYRGRNGSWSNGATAAGISSGSGTGAVKTLTSTEIDQYLRLCVVHRHDTGTSNCLWNFGQDSTLENYTTAGGNSDENGYGDFKYAPPTNFLAMCTQNLPDPAIDPAAGKQPSDYFNTVLYAGNGNTGQSITGVGFQPDFLWVKNRNMSGGYPHMVRDVVRGVTKRLRTNATDAEETSNVISSFDSDGFTFAPSQGNSFENDSAGNYVSWNWKAGGTGVSNTDGSITSTVSANPDAGFSIVTYSGNSTGGATVGHGLNAVPKMIFVMTRSGSNNKDKPVYHAGIGNTGALILNSTGGTTTWSGFWNNTTPTSTVFTLGSDQNTNQSGSNYVAYCFAEKEGYSKFGSYTGGGDGTYIHTGFKPAFVMVKNYNTSSHHWVLYDNKRNGYNTIGPYLYANLTSVESNATRVDFMSNGFVGRVSNYDIAQSGVGFIYMAFAEQPFKYANAR